MASAALVIWERDRQQRIQRLLDAHALVGGTGPGRRWRTEQLNHALVMRVAAEFQGFCRDLHDLAVDECVARAGQQIPALGGLLRTNLTQARKLDSGNAGPGTLGHDFAKLGLPLWQELKAMSPGYSPGWNEALDVLNTARNGIAHDQQSKLDEAARAGWPVSRLATLRRFLRELKGLARAMDDVVSTHVAELFGGGRPW